MLKQNEGKFAANNTQTIKKDDKSNPFWRSSTISFDIEKKGYCKEEVDLYIKELSEEYQRMYETYQEFESCENIIAKSIMSAEKAAHLIIKQAKEEAKNILLQAAKINNSNNDLPLNKSVHSENQLDSSEKLSYGRHFSEDKKVSSARLTNPVQQSFENVSADINVNSRQTSDVNNFLNELTSNVLPSKRHNSNEKASNLNFDSILAEIRGDYGKTTE